MSYFQDNTLEETLAGLRVDPAVGLSNEEAKLRLETVGPNRLDADPPTPLWKIILEQFNDLLVILLMISCVVSMALGQYAAGTTILVIVTLNATLGVIMERRAGKALDALQSSSKTLCTVFREGKLIEDFESSELVPGDIVHLTMGSKAPADCRLIEDKKLKVDEASLTGESDPVAKKTLHGKHEEHKATDVEEGGEKKLNLEHMVYMSCNVLEGNGPSLISFVIIITVLVSNPVSPCTLSHRPGSGGQDRHEHVHWRDPKDDSVRGRVGQPAAGQARKAGQAAWHGFHPCLSRRVRRWGHPRRPPRSHQ